MTEFIDTHCHIHSAGYELTGDDPTRARWLEAGKTDPDKMIKDAVEQDVKRLICVGTDLEDSERAVEFVQDRKNCWASIGLHPHEARRYASDDEAKKRMASLAARPKVVAVGECGLDYYYNHSPKAEQHVILRFQLELAIENKLPVIFHVRESFDDFWRILDDYPPIKGVVHSFTGNIDALQEVLERNLYVGLNGIMTFTKDEKQLEMAKTIPIESLLLETDAPYLTPSPYRGTICEPRHARVTAEFLASLRGENLESLANATTLNAIRLFDL